MNESQERTWAMFCHLGGFAGYFFPFGHLIVPLIFWQMKKRDSAFVDDQGKESMNFQISMSIYAVISIILAFVLIGFVLMGAIAIFGVVMIIVGAIKANNGEAYRYPLTIRLLK